MTQERLLDLDEASAEAPSSLLPAKTNLVLEKKIEKEVVRKGTKRTSDSARIQQRKRQKKYLAPSSEGESALTSAEDKPEESRECGFVKSSRPKKTSRDVQKTAPKRGERIVESGDEEIDEIVAVSQATVKKTSPRSQKTATLLEETVDKDQEGDKPKSDRTNSKIGARGKGVAKTPPTAGSESELSIVLDELPVPKKNRSSKKDLNKSTSSKKAKGPKDLTVDEAEVKRLQSQLHKCGIRKIWGVELKNYGNDSKAKIRHLRQMLRDAGMEGRFSEAKAVEIREMRELQADLEAVQDGDLKWGMGRGSRSSKNKRSMAVDIMTEEVNEDDDGSSGHGESISGGLKVRKGIPRAKLDLEFLGGEESDSE